MVADQIKLGDLTPPSQSVPLACQSFHDKTVEFAFLFVHFANGTSRVEVDVGLSR